MGDSFITIIAIFVAVILMFIFPLMAISERTDDIGQLAVQTAVTEYVDEIRNTGKMTGDQYDKLLQKLTATGNSFDIELEIKKLDINVGAKYAQESMSKIGENLYYSMYTTQIMNDLFDTTTGASKTLNLKEGDIVVATVKNDNQTIAQTLRNFFFKVAGGDTYQISAQHGGVVTVNGSTNK